MGKIPPPREIDRAAMLQRIFGSPYKYLRKRLHFYPWTAQPDYSKRAEKGEM
jgi:hypothetical protein